MTISSKFGFVKDFSILNPCSYTLKVIILIISEVSEREKANKSDSGLAPVEV